MDQKLIEISAYGEAGYKPIVDFGTWRVAMLNYIDDLQPERIDNMQRHDQTDEVFVLLSGHCILFAGDGQAEVGKIQAVNMQPLRAYNVKHGVWHSHTLNGEGSVLIVENLDTIDDNSPTRMLTPTEREQIIQLTHELWG